MTAARSVADETNASVFLFTYSTSMKQSKTQSLGLEASHTNFPSEKAEESGGNPLMRAEGILPFLTECDPQSLLASVNPATLGHSPSSVQR